MGFVFFIIPDNNIIIIIIKKDGHSLVRMACPLIKIDSVENHRWLLITARKMKTVTVTMMKKRSSLNRHLIVVKQKINCIFLRLNSFKKHSLELGLFFFCGGMGFVFLFFLLRVQNLAYDLLTPRQRRMRQTKHMRFHSSDPVTLYETYRFSFCFIN